MYEHTIIDDDGDFKVEYFSLGTGLFDCHRREIFEGDEIVAEHYEPFSMRIEFEDGMFWAKRYCRRYALSEFKAHEIKIVKRGFCTRTN